MKQTSFFFGVLTLYLCLANLVSAQDKPLKIAYVDLDRVMTESKAIRQAVNAAQDEISKEQESLTEKMIQYKTLAQTLDEQKTILTQDQIKSRRQELEDIKSLIEDKQQDINRKIRRSERELVEPAIDLVNRAIKVAGEKENLDLVLRNDLVLFASERCNITNQVIRIIDDLYKQEQEQEKNGETDARD